jgi:ferrous iron transport protein B
MNSPSPDALTPDAPAVAALDASRLALLAATRRNGRLTAALLGNPNTGKTTLFNALSGLRQRVGNYPGVTVETKKGQINCAGQTFDLIDLPGTYSLAARSPDEMVAVDVILGYLKDECRPDVIVTIVDASNLERNLYLTTQALELGVPVVVALNMIDVANNQGIRIDAEKLGRQLGVPVVPIQANQGRGLEALRAAVAAAVTSAPPRGVTFPEAFEAEVVALREAVGPDVPVFLVRRLLLDAGGYTERRFVERGGTEVGAQVKAARQRLTAAGCPVPAVEAKARYGWLRQATAGCVERPRERTVTWTDRLDRVLTHKVWGTLIFLALMFLVFQSIFTWARPLMKLIGSGKDLLADGLRGVLPAGPLSSLLVDGVLEGVGSVVVFLPQILILFAFIAILEDCGYMARAAYLMDRLMARCGLSGKSFLPLLSSVACAVPGIMAARVIENRRDRFATILVAPLMSCSARLPVYILLIGAFLTAGFSWWVPGLTMFAMYSIGLVLAPLVALALKRTLLRGETPVFVMEMPLYKWPAWRTVLGRMVDSGWAFLRRAGTIILATMVLVWALLYFPRGEKDGVTYDVRVAQLEKELETLKEEAAPDEDEEAGRTHLMTPAVAAQGLATPSAGVPGYPQVIVALMVASHDAPALHKKVIEAKENEINAVRGEWNRQSLLGRVGRAIEPAVRPLGWDWKIGMAAVASFPAREVVVGTLGIIYNQGKVESDDIREAENVADTKLARAMMNERWDGDPARKVYTVPVALSLMVFFALCCQCASTLAVIRRETRSWAWPAFTFTYMTVLAYLGALVVSQVGTRLV